MERLISAVTEITDADRGHCTKQCGKKLSFFMLQQVVHTELETD